MIPKSLSLIDCNALISSLEEGKTAYDMGNGLACTVSQYTGPDGSGTEYSFTQIINETRYCKVVNKGPETYREKDWHYVGEKEEGNR